MSDTTGNLQPPVGNTYSETTPPPSLTGGTDSGNLQIRRQPQQEPMVNVFGRQTPLSEAVRRAQILDLFGQRSEALEREIQDARRNTNTPETVRTRGLQINTAYQSIIDALDRYERIVDRTGGNFNLIPSQEQDDVRTERTNILLQLKELFNLGVLNGPDLNLMESMLVDPTYGVGWTGPFGMQNMFGNAAGRVRNNTSRLREMLRGIRNRAVAPLGMDEVGSSDFQIRRLN
jgi:hypothetical protein